jgi:ATP-dependent DNA helicase RecG
MKPSLQKLHNFFKLEAERGYDNRAVMGGLERMLPPWEAEARAENVSEELIQAVFGRLRDYTHLSPNSRAETLEGLWRRIQREANVSLNPLPPAKKEVKEPVDARPVEKKTSDASAPHHKKPEKLPQEEPSEDASQKEPKDAARSSEKPVVAPKRSTSPPQKPVPDGPPAALEAPVTVLSGVGPRHAQTLGRLGIHTLRDLLYYYPRRYDDYSQLKPINRLFYGEEVTVIGMIQNVNVRPFRGGHGKLIEAIVSDGSGSLRISWFNQPWLANRLQKGMPVVLSGKIDQYLGRLVMNSPEWEPLDQQNLHTNRIVPVYPLTANITQRWLRGSMFQVVNFWAPRVNDHLPESIRNAANLPSLATALLEVHFPTSLDNLKKARQRLAFDEIFFLQLGVVRQKRAWQDRTARIFESPPEWLGTELKKLPFELTSAQNRAIQDVAGDLESGHPMNRLLQGDVGSGKTVVAAMAIKVVISHGAQSAIMAPTSILAEQHYQSLKQLLIENNGDQTDLLTPEQICLLIGSTPEAEKRTIRDGLVNGAIKVVVGTHALIEEPVTFSDLQLAIVDEQHRFGVDQRAQLRSKGDNPHLLVMTATPIPRSLALTVYGDLDLTVMDEMPPGRQKVDTHVLLPLERERAYTLIRGQLEQGRQAFIIYPLVGDEENDQTLAAVTEYERLQKEIFPKIKVGLLHGRMKTEEKEATMTRFRDGGISILVSTTVIEVGVDVPNATVMLIEGANRFGLAQLHQLRGRVGRGHDKSFCLLIPESADVAENERLQAMVETNDGFILAERDLQQRGPGEFLGTRQSGLPDEIRLANLFEINLIEKARRYALEVYEQDPELKQPKNQLLAQTLQRFWGNSDKPVKGDIS